MADPWQFLEAVVVGLVPAAVVILLARQRGWFDSVSATVLVAAAAAAVAGIAMVWWTGRRAEWEVRDASTGGAGSGRAYLASVAFMLLLGSAVAGAATFALVTMGTGAHGPRVSFPPADEVAPLGTVDPDWTVQSIEGESLSFADLRGKTVFVNFWATWCPPCVAEMPSIQDLSESLAGEEIEFLLISHEPAAVVTEFLSKTGYTFPVYVAEDRPPPVLESDGLPATFIVNQNGEVVFRHLGMADWDSDECRRFLRELP